MPDPEPMVNAYGRHSYFTNPVMCWSYACRYDPRPELDDCLCIPPGLSPQKHLAGPCPMHVKTEASIK